MYIYIYIYIYINYYYAILCNTPYGLLHNSFPPQTRLAGGQISIYSSMIRVSGPSKISAVEIAIIHTKVIGSNGLCF